MAIWISIPDILSRHQSNKYNLHLPQFILEYINYTEKVVKFSFFGKGKNFSIMVISIAPNCTILYVSNIVAEFYVFAIRWNSLNKQ